MIGLTAKVFVTDVVRDSIPVVGDTMAERRANGAAAAAWEARAERLASVAARMRALVSAGLPALADERALAALRSVIARMCETGDLYMPKRDEMLASVAFAEEGSVSVRMVDLFGNVLDLTGSHLPV